MNTNPTSIEFTAKVFLPTYFSMKEVMDGKSMPAFCEGDGSYYVKEGYPQIGTARIIITLDTNDKIVANQIDALKAQLQTVRAENKQRENAILNKISKLSALPNAGSAT